MTADILLQRIHTAQHTKNCFCVSDSEFSTFQNQSYKPEKAEKVLKCKQESRTVKSSFKERFKREQMDVCLLDVPEKLKPGMTVRIRDLPAISRALADVMK